MQQLFRSLTILFVLFSMGSQAQDMTPVESFIYHLKDDNQFVSVNNIWTADNNYDKAAMLKKVEKP
ncbi:MAG: hypothetical protein EBZ77_14750, partial [Chitinophagia bacterium]|nr:hypothetical protein [Chitinophagia bacterium]